MLFLINLQLNYLRAGLHIGKKEFSIKVDTECDISPIPQRLKGGLMVTQSEHP